MKIHHNNNDLGLTATTANFKMVRDYLQKILDEIKTKPYESAQDLAEDVSNAIEAVLTESDLKMVDKYMFLAVAKKDKEE